MRLLNKISATKNAVTILLLLVLAAIIFAYYEGVLNLLQRWSIQEEYSHGYFIPFVVLYFIYQKRVEIVSEKMIPAWSGVGVVITALIMLFLGELSAIYILVHYSLIVLLIGLVLAIAGKRVLQHILIPLLILCFAIPLPYFIDSALSWKLQLISSQLGVLIIRFFDVPVFLEGNVIDLGNYKLQVVEACSGLNYLFPLMSLGFIAAYLYQAPFWQRTVVFLSTIPITIFMNSIRIGIIGILVAYWGVEMAEGFLHFFEGWVIFMACLFLLGVEMWLLTKLRPDKPNLSDVFWIEPSKNRSAKQSAKLTISSPFIVAAILVASMAIGVNFISDRDEFYPERETFNSFPHEIGEWEATESKLIPDVVQSLKLDDYYMADYQKGKDVPVNMYLAYYQSQRKGASPHSPRVCIPGGGWKINSLNRETIKLNNGIEFPVNRLVIAKGEARQVVYYWFQQRGRKIANEYWMKWYLLQDAILKNRTDGALVRFTIYLDPHSSETDADKRIQDLINIIYPYFDKYIPM